MEACKNAGTSCSPLFYTNRTSSQVHSLFTLAGVLQGSTVADFFSSISILKSVIMNVVQMLTGPLSIAPHLLNVRLSHWGLGFVKGDTLSSFMDRLSTSSWAKKDSNALFDLRVDSKFFYFYYH